MTPEKRHGHERRISRILLLASAIAAFGAATAVDTASAQGPGRGDSRHAGHGHGYGHGHGRGHGHDRDRRPPSRRPPIIVVRPAPPPAPIAPYSVQQVVEVQWGATWYTARVVEVLSPSAFRIHYEGWADSWNEVVGLDRIRPFGIVPQPNVPPPSPVSTNLIVDGGFESPALQFGTWQVVGSLPGWFVTRGSGIEVQSSVAGSPFEGRQHIELDAHEPTELAQDVSVVPGVTYRLSVAFSARPGTTLADNRATVFWNDMPILRLAADGTRLTDTRWQVYSADFVANARFGRLTIRYDGTPDSIGGYVDDVRLVAIR